MGCPGDDKMNSRESKSWRNWYERDSPQGAHTLKSKFASQCHYGAIPQLGPDHSAVFQPYSRTDMHAVVKHLNRKST